MKTRQDSSRQNRTPARHSERNMDFTIEMCDRINEDQPVLPKPANFESEQASRPVVHARTAQRWRHARARRV